MYKYLTMSNFIYTGCIIFLAFVTYSSLTWLTTSYWYYDGCSFSGYYNVEYTTPVDHYGYWVVLFLPFMVFIKMPMYFSFPGLVFLVVSIVLLKLKIDSYSPL